MFVSVALVVASAALAAGAGAVKTPKHHVFEPASLGMTFELPSEWAGGRGKGRESKFFAVAPGPVAELEILAGPTKLSSDAFASAFKDGERAIVMAGDPRGKVVTRPLEVGAGTPATEIIATYRGIGEISQAPGEKLVVVLYGFVHRGKAFILQFMTTDTWLPKLRPEFRHSAKSVQFPFVA
jgi:hypothetical protein